MEQIYKLYSSLPELEQRKTWAEIDLGALRHNYRLLRETVSADENPARIIAVVTPRSSVLRLISQYLCVM